jgi:hypothetical protein
MLMVMLTKLLKAAIWTAILNGVVRGAFRNALIKSMNWILQPSMRSAIGAFLTNLMKVKPGSNYLLSHGQTLLKAALALALLRFTKKSWIIWIIESVGISTIGALLLALIRSREGYETTGKHGQKDQIIDIDEFTIVDEKP